ncbi:hypothetical protein I3843_04G072400 [Carya illinoinensis]|nr:hypothetical protein I3843_04G072400 [Carya illinoinensis]
MLPAEATSSLVLNRVGSSIVFAVYGNVYPIGIVFGGIYNVTLNIGQPSKPYFLDPDTGGDLMAPAPNPLYRSDNNAIICNDPLCKLLHPTGDHKCENPEQQCNYEVQFGDGGPSLRALVKDVFYLNSVDGIQLKPRLALGLVKKELTGREALDDKTPPLCWRGRMPFQSLQDVRKYFKPLALSFTNGEKAKIQLELPPDAYLIISIKARGECLLGILDGTEAGQNISMQDKIYDNEKQLIGWDPLPYKLDRLPTSKSVA